MPYFLAYHIDRLTCRVKSPPLAGHGRLKYCSQLVRTNNDDVVERDDSSSSSSSSQQCLLAAVAATTARAAATITKTTITHVGGELSAVSSSVAELSFDERAPSLLVNRQRSTVRLFFPFVVQENGGRRTMAAHEHDVGDVAAEDERRLDRRIVSCLSTDVRSDQTGSDRLRPDRDERKRRRRRSLSSQTVVLAPLRQD